MKATEQQQAALEGAIDWDRHPTWTGFHVSVMDTQSSERCTDPDPCACHSDRQRVTVLRPSPSRRFVVKMMSGLWADGRDGRWSIYDNEERKTMPVTFYDEKLAERFAAWVESHK